MDSGLSTTSLGNQPRPQESTAAPTTLADSVQAPDVLDPNTKCAEQEQREKEPESRDRLQDVPASASGSAIHTDENEEMVITRIQATNVALGLRRTPAGFYTVVYHSGLEWRTEIKHSSLNNDIVVWDELISIPSDLSTIVCLEVYASFEFRPLLGTGEQLRRITITVGQLLDRSMNNVPFTFFPKDGDVVSSCSSIMVTVQRQKGKGSVLAFLGSNRSITGSQGELEEATNQGHSALSRYQKHGKIQDLERCIEEFERALDICSLDHPCRAVAQSNLAMAKFVHCQVDDTTSSLELPLSLYRNALAARPVGHVDRPFTLIQLAMVHFAQFEKWEDEAEIACAGALLLEAMKLSSPESHEQHTANFLHQLLARRKMSPVQEDNPLWVLQDSTSCLVDEDPWTLSRRLLDCFEKFRDLADLQRAITLLGPLVRSTLISGDRYHAGLANLGVALSYRYDHLGELSDLEDAISRQRDAIDNTPHDHPSKPVYLNNLGNSFLARFRRLGEPHDLEDAISTLRNAVDLTPHSHPFKPTVLDDLGSSFLIRFEHFGELSDLMDAILLQRDAVDLTPDGHPGKPAHLNNLSCSIRARFKRLGELTDLEDAISMLRDAVDLTPDGHFNQSAHMSSLGSSFLTRFEHLGELSDLEHAVSRHKDAIHLTPDGHLNKPAYLGNLGNSFFTRFERLGELSDLDNAISIYRNVVDLTPHGHLDKPAHLGNLGNSFFTRFVHLGELGDLEQAISAYRFAIDLTPLGHPDNPARLSNLGSSVNARFRRLGRLGDLEEAISRQRDAVDLTPDGHPDKPAHLGNLGNSFFTRFMRFGELGDLEQAISRYRFAIDLTPPNHPNRPTHLNNLGSSIRVRFGHLGKLMDIEEGIAMHKHAVGFTPDGHPDKPAYLNNLGNSFLVRFERLGELTDLENAISMLRNAVGLTPHCHPDKFAHLNNLGNSLLTRFERLGELHDLEDAISTLKDAVSLIPDGHPDKPAYLNNLSNSFTARFGHLGELSDLEDAISMLRNAINLTPRGHPDKSALLNNLGNTLLTRFKCLGELSDLEEAISRQKDVVDHTPHGHPDKPAYLSNLGNSLRVRFGRLGELGDLERAIYTQRDALDLTPHSHPDKPARLSNLGNSFRARFEHLGELSNLEQAISLFSHAASISIGPITVRFRASQKWISCAWGIRHHTLLEAYFVAVGLLPQLAWTGLSLSRRYHELIQGADIVREAAAAALDLGLPEIAIEWLEQGRSIVWGELYQLRSSYQELLFAHPDHAHKLQEVSVALEHASAAHEKSSSTLSGQPQDTVHRITGSTQEADRHRMLAIERDKLLQEIRCFPGFEQFLLRKEFSQIHTWAHSGPVVILNAAKSRCDALIVLAGLDYVIHVPLPAFTLERLVALQETIKNWLRHYRGMRYNERKGIVVSQHHIDWESLLSLSWEGVVKPVLDALAFSTPGDLTRIFWCPTGVFIFLPLHAAGLYGIMYSQPGHKVSDFVVSSYVPTLSILALSLRPSAAPTGNLRLLAVGQPPSDGLPTLPGVAIELEHIRKAIGNSPSAHTTLLESSVGTVEEVLELMEDADWVHFACHGVQDGVDSGLCLADGRRLKLRDITVLSRPHGGLAFLSACQTAMGEENLSDEAIHLAAGMLFAGYGGVIGTMWSISDMLAPDVARDVYEELFRDGTPDYRDAALALHRAIGSLREREVTFDKWLPFIHVGL